MKARPTLLSTTGFPKSQDENPDRDRSRLIGFSLPPAEYALLEMYCDEPQCDCRRVFFYVLSSRSKSSEAVVAYGWESAEFYANWAHEDDPEVIRQLKGPVLNLASPQSRHAPEILRLIGEAVLRDSAYVERLRAHYNLFRRHVDECETRGAEVTEDDV